MIQDRIWPLQLRRSNLLHVEPEVAWLGSEGSGCYGSGDGEGGPEGGGAKGRVDYTPKPDKKTDGLSREGGVGPCQLQLGG